MHQPPPPPLKSWHDFPGVSAPGGRAVPLDGFYLGNTEPQYQSDTMQACVMLPAAGPGA